MFYICLCTKDWHNTTCSLSQLLKYFSFSRELTNTLHNSSPLPLGVFFKKKKQKKKKKK